MGLDLHRLSKTLLYILRNSVPTSELVADAEGWLASADLARVVSRTIHRPVRPEEVELSLQRYARGRVDVETGRLRMPGPSTPSRDRGGGPDLLFHAIPRDRVAGVVEEGNLTGTAGSRVFLSRSEPHAWRVAHRSWTDPVVLYVDAARARRDGVTFDRNKAGLYTTESIPVRHVLNLRDGFAEQASAGGFLVEWASGEPRVALIKVSRRHGSTWEVAKGKLENGEAPSSAAVREVREEMGFDNPVHPRRTLGTIRYGFYTREGTPRLKTIYLYLLEAEGTVGSFSPAGAEGIEAVRWFGVAELVHALAHPSLRSSLGRLLEALDERARELGLAGVDEAWLEKARSAG